MLKILPESVSSPMTRAGIESPSGHQLRGVRIEDFPVAHTSRGDMWLPPEKVIDRARTGVCVELGRRAARPPQQRIGEITHAELLRAFDSSTLLPKTYCVEPPRASSMSREAISIIVWAALSLDTGFMPLTPLDRCQDVRLCGNENCICPRHYNIIPRVKNREHLLEPDYRFYSLQPDNTIITIWGDTLPSVQQSMSCLRELQLRCPPHVPTGCGPLTLSGISKIGFDAVTGCWPVSTYYSRDGLPTDQGRWEKDGYDRIGLTRLLSDSLGMTRNNTSQPPAHRVVWLATGNTYEYERGGRPMPLNHLCGHKPCANPLHLEQVSTAQNIEHGRAMTRAIAKLDKELEQLIII